MPIPVNRLREIGREYERRWWRTHTGEVRQDSGRPENTEEVRPRIETTDEVSIGFDPNGNTSSYPEYRRHWSTYPSERMSLDPEPICAADFESDFDDWYRKEMGESKAKRKCDFKNDNMIALAEGKQINEWSKYKKEQKRNNKCWGFL